MCWLGWFGGNPWKHPGQLSLQRLTEELLRGHQNYHFFYNSNTLSTSETKILRQSRKRYIFLWKGYCYFSSNYSRRIKDTKRRRHAQKQLSLKKLLGQSIKSHTEKPCEKTDKIKSFQEEVGASIWARHKSDYPWRNSWSNQSVRAIERNLASKTKPGRGFCFSVKQW